MESSNMSNLTFKQQITLFYKTDIIIAGHGSALTNSIFALPRSVMIENFPPYFYEMCFANIAFISQLHYIAVTNYDFEIIRRNNMINAERLYNEGKFYSERRRFANFLVYPNPFSVKAAMIDAIEYVRHKRVSPLNDFWSYVFY